MKVRIGVKELDARVRQLASVVESKNQVPVYGHVRFSVGPDGIALIKGIGIAAALEVQVPVKEVYEQGAVLLFFKQLSDFLPTLASEDIVIEGSGTRVSYRSGKNNTSLNVESVEAFDKVEPTPESYKEVATLGRGGFKDSIDKILFAVPPADGKYSVTTALLHSTNKQVRLVATDGHRIILSSQDSDLGAEFKIQLPKNALDLAAILSGDMITLSESEGAFLFTTGATTSARPIEALTVRKHAGEFPPYERVMPTAFKTELKFAQAQLKRALDSLLTMTSDDLKYGISLTYTEGQSSLVLRADGPYGFAVDEIDVVGTGPSFETKANGDFLKDYVNLASGDLLLRTAVSSGSNLDLYNGPLYRYLLAPLKA